MLWAVLAAGWIAAGRALRRTPIRMERTPQVLVPGAIVTLVAVFLAVTELPGAVFNPHDDFQIYFPRVVQMLQTGTLGGNPFDSIGLDTLGNQAFLQSFPLLLSGLEFLSAFDAVFAALLALALIPGAARLLGCPTAVLAAAMLAFILQPVQQVNSSAVYIQTAFTLALLPATADFLGRSQKSAADLCREAFPIALLLAAFAALKLTTASFVVLACVALFLVVWALRGLRAALRAGSACGLLTALALAPWFLLGADKFVAVLRASSTA